MSDLKIPGAQVQLPVGNAGGEAPMAPAVAKKLEAPPLLPGGLADVFKGIAQQAANAGAALTGLALGIPLSAVELAVQAKQIATPGDVQGAFHGAFAVIKDQLL